MFASSFYFFSEYVFLMLINNKLLSKTLRRGCGDTKKEALSFIKVCTYVLVGWDFRTMLQVLEKILFFSLFQHLMQNISLLLSQRNRLSEYNPFHLSETLAFSSQVM